MMEELPLVLPTPKRRKKGEGSFSANQKKMRASGQEYIGNSMVIEAKRPPPNEVGLFYYFY